MPYGNSFGRQGLKHIIQYTETLLPASTMLEETAGSCYEASKAFDTGLAPTYLRMR